MIERHMIGERIRGYFLGGAIDGLAVAYERLRPPFAVDLDTK